MSEFRVVLSRDQETFLHTLGETNAQMGGWLVRFLLLAHASPHEISKYTWDFVPGAIVFKRSPANPAKSPAGKRVKGAP